MSLLLHLLIKIMPILFSLNIYYFCIISFFVIEKTKIESCMCVCVCFIVLGIIFSANYSKVSLEVILHERSCEAHKLQLFEIATQITTM